MRVCVQAGGERGVLRGAQKDEILFGKCILDGEFVFSSGVGASRKSVGSLIKPSR